MPPPTSTETPSKVKTTFVFLFIAMVMLFLLHTLYIRVKHSDTIALVVMVNIIISFLAFHYRRNPDQTLHPPLFSFPSLSRPSRYRPLAGNSDDLAEPVVNVPPVVPPHLEPDTVYDGRSTDGVVWERGEPSGRISTEYWERGEPSGTISSEYWERQEPSVRNSTEYWERREPSVRKSTEYPDTEASDLANEGADDGQGSNETLDETWYSIIATGKAKPVRLFTSSQREGNPKRGTKKPTTEKREERIKETESTSYDSVERRAPGPSTRVANSISSDELTNLSEMFIRKHHNNLRMERQESDQRRLLKKLGVREYPNAVSV